MRIATRCVRECKERSLDRWVGADPGREHKVLRRASEKRTVWDGREEAWEGQICAHEAGDCQRWRPLCCGLPEGQLAWRGVGTKGQKRLLCALSVPGYGSRLPSICDWDVVNQILKYLWGNRMKRCHRKHYRAGMLVFAPQITFPIRLNEGKWLTQTNH